MLVLVTCFSCTPDDTSSEVFLLPHASFSESFLLQTSASFSEVFLLHTWWFF